MTYQKLCSSIKSFITCQKNVGYETNIEFNTASFNPFFFWYLWVSRLACTYLNSWGPEVNNQSKFLRLNQPELYWLWPKPDPFIHHRPITKIVARIKATFHNLDENHLSCKRDCCPCQNSNSSGWSLYPPQCLGFGIILLQNKNKKIHSYGKKCTNSRSQDPIIWRI